MNTVKLTFAFILALTMNVFAQNPNNDPSLAGKALLDADDHVLIMIDHEGQMAFAVQSIDIQTLRNNVGLVAGTAKLFDVNTIITTVAEKSFSGPLFPEIKEYFPNHFAFTVANSEGIPLFENFDGLVAESCQVFGISGFVIGPVIAALFLSVWVMFEDEHLA